MQKIITKYSNKYGIPQALIRAIIQVESSGNTYAMRYEKHYKWLYKPERFGTTLDTEITAQKTSWGLMQVMGAVARERGFNRLFLSELLKPDFGIRYGCLHLKGFYNRYESWNDAISAYNQGSNRKDKNGNYKNQVYLEKVLKKWR